MKDRLPDTQPETGDPPILPAFQRGHQAEFRPGPGEPRKGATDGFKLPRLLPGGRKLRGERQREG